LWDLHAIESPRQIPAAACIALSSLETVFATCTSDGIVGIQKVESNKLVWTFHANPSNEFPQIMAISPDNKKIVLCEVFIGLARIFDLQTGQPRAILPRRGGWRLGHVSFHSSSARRQLVFIGGGLAHVELWDLDTHTCVGESVNWALQSVVCVAFSPRNDLVAWLEKR
jgi:WD40 repeat protein